MKNNNEPRLRTDIANEDFEARRLRNESMNQARSGALRPGFDLHHWQHARLLERIIESGWAKGTISADLTSCTMSKSEFIDHWYDVQDSIAYGILAGLDIVPISLPDFREVLERYRISGANFLALIPKEQWSKDFRNWDPRVIDFTLRHSIVLPNAIARARQEAVAFALLHFNHYLSPSRPSLKNIYMRYRVELLNHNQKRQDRGELNLGALGRREFQGLRRFYPPFEIEAARHGVEAARRMFAPRAVNDGDQVNG